MHCPTGESWKSSACILVSIPIVKQSTVEAGTLIFHVHKDIDCVVLDRSSIHLSLAVITCCRNMIYILHEVVKVHTYDITHFRL